MRSNLTNKTENFLLFIRKISNFYQNIKLGKAGKNPKCICNFIMQFWFRVSLIQSMELALIFVSRV